MHKTNVPGVLTDPRPLPGTELFPEVYGRQMREAGELLRALRRAPLQLVADDVGTGKTWVAMMVIFSRLHEALEAAKRSGSGAAVRPQRAIVIAPTRSVQSKWVRELRRFAAQCLPDPGGVSVHLISSRQGLLERYVNAVRGVGRPPSRFNDVLEEPAPLQRLLGSLEGRRAFVVYLHDECVEQGWRGESELVERWKKSVFSYAAYRAAFRAVLPQGEVLALAGELLAYGRACGRWVWLDMPYDAGAVTSDEAGRGRFSTRLSDLNGLVFAEHLPRELAEKRIDRFICAASALWRAHERRAGTRRFPGRGASGECAAASDFCRCLCARLESGREKGGERTKIVRGLLARILREGLGSGRLPIFRSALKKDALARFDEAGREPASDIRIEPRRAACLVNELAAFSQRVYELALRGDGRRTKPIALGDAILNLYSPAGVFRDLEDLRREAKTVADAAQEVRLAMFVAPVYGANASCEMMEYVARMLCELAAFEDAPDRVGSGFWHEVRKTQIVDVVYMRDLNGAPEGSGESISTAVVDEAHNWHLGNNGAEGFRKFLRGRVERSLLLTATPLQLSETELKRIFDKVLPDRSDATNGDFWRAYDALFANDGVTASLRMLREKSKKFERELLTLAGDDEARASLERAAAHVSDGATSAEKLRVWSALAGREEPAGLHLDVLDAGAYPAVRELAKAALCYKEAQEAILRHLRCLAVKTRSGQFLDDEGTIPSRRWHVGVETDRGVGIELPNAVEAALRPGELHAAPGLVPDDAYLWTNLIGMRLTTFDGADGTRPRPRPHLLIGLPSSYGAHRESAQARGLQSAKMEAPEGDEAFYASLLNRMLSVPAGRHPKVGRTVDIVLKAWQRGEKTLVFAERRETIAELERCIRAELDRRLQGEVPLRQLVLEALETLPSPLDERAVIEAALDAAQRFCGTQFGLDGSASVDVWRCALLEADRVPPGQANYDARAAWIVMAALNFAAGGSGERVGKAIHSRLYALRNESRPGPNHEGSEVRLYDAVRTVTGDTENRNLLLETFNSPFPPLVLVCSTVGQEGVDMHRFCRTVVLHDLGWNPAKLEQRVGRLDRVASLSRVRRAPVEIYVPYLADGYDAWKFSRVLRRVEMQEALFGINEGAPERDLDPDAELERQTPEWPALGNLMRRFFEMDLSVSSRLKRDGLNAVTGTGGPVDGALEGEC